MTVRVTIGDRLHRWRTAVTMGGSWWGIRLAVLRNRFKGPRAGRFRRRPLPTIDQPFVLISQIQRSGGTLTSQLFDHHPQCHVHPDEVSWGSPNKRDWPSLDPSRGGPRTWFRALDEEPTWQFIAGGYKKGDHTDPLPFVFDRGTQLKTFRMELDHGSGSRREILDAYLTAYFRAWLDYQGYGPDPKRWVVGFVPRVNMHQDSVERFFEDYPDGRLISIVRDPYGWYASAKSHSPAYRPLERGLEKWRASIQASLDLQSKRPSQVHLVHFADLLARTEPTMRALCTALGLDWHPILTVPTFNGIPIRPNSNHGVFKRQVSSIPLTKFEEVLSVNELERIHALADEFYRRAVEACIVVGAERKQPISPKLPRSEI